MTVRQIVRSLIEKGQTVDYYVRKDGSIRVTNLNGEKFSSRLSTGNDAARVLLETLEGRSVEEAKVEVARSTSFLRSQRAAARAVRKAGTTLKSQTAETQSKFKELQRLVKRINKANTKGQKDTFIPVSWKRTLDAAKKRGISPTAQINRLLDYLNPIAENVAPVEMVDGTINRAAILAPRFPFLFDHIEFLEANRKIQDIYALDVYGNSLYELAVLASDDDGETVAKVKAAFTELKAKAHYGA